MQYTGRMTDAILTSRTALFTPATHPDRVRKALTGRSDAVIIDMEDAVASPDKNAARQQLQHLLTEVDVASRSRLVVRINAPDTPDGQQDVTMLSQTEELPAAIMVPKSEADATLDELPPTLAALTVIALVETPTGVRDIYQIAAHERVDRLAVGAIDLSTALGCDVDSAPISYARSQAVIASSAAGIPAPLDSPCTNFRKSNVVGEAAASAVRDGFGGMLCIHPAQLEPIQQAFTPSDEKIAWAQRVLTAGEGAGSVDGEMVDRPVFLRAQRIMQDMENARA